MSKSFFNSEVHQRPFGDAFYEDVLLIVRITDAIAPAVCEIAGPQFDPKAELQAVASDLLAHGMDLMGPRRESAMSAMYRGASYAIASHRLSNTLEPPSVSSLTGILTKISSAQLARVCHEALLAHDIESGLVTPENRLPIHETWDKLSDRNRSTFVEQIRFLLANPGLDAWAFHKGLVAEGAGMGWKHGPNSPKNLTLEWMTDWRNLDRLYRRRFFLLVTLVRTMHKVVVDEYAPTIHLGRLPAPSEYLPASPEEEKATRPIEMPKAEKTPGTVTGMDRVKAMVEKLSVLCKEEGITLIVAAHDGQKAMSGVGGHRVQIIRLYQHLREAINEQLEIPKTLSIEDLMAAPCIKNPAGRSLQEIINEIASEAIKPGAGN